MINRHSIFITIKCCCDYNIRHNRIHRHSVCYVIRIPSYLFYYPQTNEKVHGWCSRNQIYPSRIRLTIACINNCRSNDTHGNVLPPFLHYSFAKRLCESVSVRVLSQNVLCVGHQLFDRISEQSLQVFLRVAF
jgi:hypothetical protein